MISQLFILSKRGDVLINRDLRSDLIKATPEFFFRKVQLSELDCPPVFNIEGINYIHLRKVSVYLVATTRFNTSPTSILNLLKKFCNVIKDFCGEFTEESIRKNFILIYELIDEIFDFGYPQFTNTNEIEKHIVSQPDICQNFQLPGLKIFEKNVKKAEDTHIPITESEKRNEIFVDVIENMNVILNSSNIPVSSYVYGIIKIKSYLTGTPSLNMNLNIDTYFDDYNFHECVNHKDFEFNRKLVVNPPKGEFNLMSYRISRDFEQPFKVYTILNQISTYKVQLNIQLESNLKKSTTAKQVVLQFQVPNCTSKVYNSVNAKNKNFQSDYDEKEKKVVWVLDKLSGEFKYDFESKIILTEQIVMSQVRKELGPIKMGFEINQRENAPIQIKSLVIEGTTKDNPGKWVRYITTSNSYIVRIQQFYLLIFFVFKNLQNLKQQNEKIFDCLILYQLTQTERVKLFVSNLQLMYQYQSRLLQN